MYSHVYTHTYACIINNNIYKDAFLCGHWDDDQGEYCVL